MLVALQWRRHIETNLIRESNLAISGMDKSSYVIRNTNITSNVTLQRHSQI